MHYSKLTVLIPYILLFSVCTAVTPAYKDNGTRGGPCVEKGPDNVAQQFYDYRILRRSDDTITLRSYLSDKLATLPSDAFRDNNHRGLLTNDPFFSHITLLESARVASALTILSRNTQSIPLRVDLRQDDQSWQDKVLTIQEGQCWVIDDVRYLGGSVHATAGTFRQSIENC